MLVLALRLGQRIRIGNVEIQPLVFKGDALRVGIAAPKYLPIDHFSAGGCLLTPPRILEERAAADAAPNWEI